MREMKVLACLILILSISACSTPKKNPQAPVDKVAAENQIHIIMDDWHEAAAVADADAFFGAMPEDGIYLGTDKSERWKRDELRKWSEGAFKRDTAWAFTASDRVVYFSEDGKTAWFEELLDTWMGPCRGSGVLTLSSDRWMLVHYNLAMLIDNDDVSAVLETIRL